MSERVLNGQPARILLGPLVMSCPIFQTKPTLLAKSYDVQSRVSLGSLQVFIGAISGSEAAITHDNVRDVSLLCEDFKFAAPPKTISEWQRRDRRSTFACTR
jgi:hypothetical protein